MDKSLDNLKTLGMELAKRHKSIANYVPPEGKSIYKKDLYSSAESVAERRSQRLTEKFLPFASTIQEAYPVGFEKWGPLAVELGSITEQIQETHGETWEKMITLLKEMIRVEVPIQLARIQLAHAQELERMKRKYEATLRTVHTKYIKWKSLACTPQADDNEDSDDIEDSMTLS